MLNQPEEFRALVDAKPFRATFGELSQHGHALQRVPRGYPPDHPEARTFKLKDVVFGRRLSDAEAESPDLPVVIAETLAAGKPLLAWLARLA